MLALEERFHEAMLNLFEIEIISGSNVIEVGKAYYCANRRPEDMPKKVREILVIAQPKETTRLRGRPPRSDDQPTSQYLNRLKYLTEYFVSLYYCADRGDIYLNFSGDICDYKVPKRLKIEIYENLRRDYGPLPDFKTFNNILSELQKDMVLSYRVMNAVAARLRAIRRAAAQISDRQLTNPLAI